MSKSAAISTIATLKRSVRFSDWSESKIPMLTLAGAYICLWQNQAAPQFVFKYLLFVFVFAAAHCAFGYLINDFGDIEVDREQGKRNTFLQLGRTDALRLLGAVVAVMVISGLPFASNLGFFTLWMLAVSTSMAYSLPPFRLKVRGLPGILISTVAQCTLPILLLGVALSADSLVFLAPFILASTISGATLELGHQNAERQADARTETDTFAVRLGAARTRELYNTCLWFDRISVGVLLTLSIFATRFSAAGLVLELPLLLLYLASLVSVVQRQIKGQEIDPYYGNRNLADRMLHHMLPGVLLPASLLLVLTASAHVWAIALAVFLAWRVTPLLAQLLKSPETRQSLLAKCKL